MARKFGMKGKRAKLSNEKLLYIKKKYRYIDIFANIEKNPSIYFGDRSSKWERKMNKFETKDLYNSSQYLYGNFSKWESEIPDYIYLEMKKNRNSDKTLLTISGNKDNPNVHYICKRCKEEQVQTIRQLNKGLGHNCSSSKSSGEFEVESYLKNFFKIKTQYETFKCINPITKRQMPYDIEVLNKKVLIEIQGDQHYKFIEYFHGTMENFEYQKRKDSYKKRYAESKGYKVIYINYDEIKTGSYREKLASVLGSKLN